MSLKYEPSSEEDGFTRDECEAIGKKFVPQYRGTSLIRNTPLLGPHSRTIHGVLWWSYGGGRFLMSEVPLYAELVHARGRGGFVFAGSYLRLIDSCITQLAGSYLRLIDSCITHPPSPSPPLQDGFTRDECEAIGKKFVPGKPKPPGAARSWGRSNLPPVRTGSLPRMQSR